MSGISKPSTTNLTGDVRIQDVESTLIAPAPGAAIPFKLEDGDSSNLVDIEADSTKPGFNALQTQDEGTRAALAALLTALASPSQEPTLLSVDSKVGPVSAGFDGGTGPLPAPAGALTLPAQPITKGVTLQASITNTGIISVGFSAGVSATTPFSGIQLPAGGSIALAIDDLSKVYYDWTTATDELIWAGG